MIGLISEPVQASNQSNYQQKSTKAPPICENAQFELQVRALLQLNSLALRLETVWLL